MFDRIDVRSWPALLWNHPLPFLLCFLVGASGALLYSYAPLHSSKNWQIEYLEDRLSARNQEVDQMTEELREARADSENGPEPQELLALNNQIQEMKKQLRQMKKSQQSDADKLAKITRSRDQWKDRHDEAERKLAARSAPTPPAPRDESTAAADIEGDLQESGLPAAPDPGSGRTTLIQGAVVAAGESWASPDGKIRIEVLSVSDDQASIDRSWQTTSPSAPAYVRAGEELTANVGDRIYQIAFREISPARSVTIDAFSESAPQP